MAQDRKDAPESQHVAGGTAGREGDAASPSRAPGETARPEPYPQVRRDDAIERPSEDRID